MPQQYTSPWLTPASEVAVMVRAHAAAHPVLTLASFVPPGKVTCEGVGLHWLPAPPSASVPGVSPGSVFVGRSSSQTMSPPVPGAWPSCPSVLRPQHQRVLSFLSAHANSVPAEMATMPVSPGIFCGVLLQCCVPHVLSAAEGAAPSSAFWFEPQHQTVPSSRSAQSKKTPAATVLMSVLHRPAAHVAPVGQAYV